MYKIFVRPIFFLFKPETIHHIVFICLKIAQRIPLLPLIIRKIYQVNHKNLEKEIFGLKFSNPIGLAAGLDKNAEVFDMLGYLGFSHIEIGTVTPKPQPGNPKPRLFRIIQDEALINRMGFNNLGVEEVIKNLKKRKSNVIIGGNIGKNKVTPNEEANNDYRICYTELYPYVDYFVVNVSSPNTPNLRELQDKEPLKKLLLDLKDLNQKQTVPKPILLKIAPDLTNDQLDDIIEIG
jgi:dihydroorotate dehydrogenase